MPDDAKAAKPVKIMLLCDHVYLPEDPTAEGWETSADTIKYAGEDGESRRRLDVHPELAKFLKKRKQAEIL